MRQSLRTCVLMAAASSVLGGTAYADAGAGGGASDSPGVLSGNSIQVSVDTPVNACGNSVDGAAALNPAMGNSCGNGAAPAPAVPPPPVAQRPPVSPGKPAEPVRQQEKAPARHAAPVPAQPAPGKAHPAGHRPAQEAVHRSSAPRSVPGQRMGAVARAGASAGSALLANTGTGELGTAAGTGGGLLLGGALLLRRARTRRR